MVQRDTLVDIQERMKALKEVILQTAGDRYRLGGMEHLRFLRSWQAVYEDTALLLEGEYEDEGSYEG